MAPDPDETEVVPGEAALPSWRYAPGAEAGRFEGEPYGSEVSFFVVDAPAGEGPALHRHPYSETFVVLAGRARFELGESTIVAGAGDVAVAPAGTAHGFSSIGPERLRMVTIHAAATMETTWLESAGADAG
jgi:quercetin dioxygenase-like cupin family protein